MDQKAQREAARRFAAEWKGRGREKKDDQTFWNMLLRDVFGVEHTEKILSYQMETKFQGKIGWIDAYIRPTRVLIEQKSLGVDLHRAEVQSDGTSLTPYQQARRYANNLSFSLKPRWIVLCNFSTFLVYDMEHPGRDPEEILLEHLPKEYWRLQFLVDGGSHHLQAETEVSLQAGEIVGRLYDAFLERYINPGSPATLHSLNVLCVRLVFCLYAEDAGIFGRHALFHDYMAQYPLLEMRRALIDLFRVLDTPAGRRDPYLTGLLAEFPYVNGNLFAGEDIEIPNFTPAIADLLLKHASAGFDWSRISPTIFGAVFESTLNPETRRKGGMHYTSVENIHKVIDPLFLDALRAELGELRMMRERRAFRARMEQFRAKLASLRFLDPACGSGNFLTETYLSLRRMENECLRLVGKGQVHMGGGFSPIRVSIGQFYGIELNDFAVAVARTALWIAESQMMQETEAIVGRELDYLPLKSYPNIMEGNALAADWDALCPREEMGYVIGNPPFAGARMMKQGSREKKEIQDLFGKIKDVQDLDYVCGWYKKAAEYIQGTKIEVAFVSTNSICQGAQVAVLWNVLLHEYGIRINFAWCTFKWNSEANEKAAVHCVIVGFSLFDRAKKFIYNVEGEALEVANISPYLVPGTNVLVSARSHPLCDVPKMSFGNQPRDGGNFVISPQERDEILSKSPDVARWLRSYIGAEEFINGKERWCLWLKNATPTDIRTNNILYQKVSAVREFRLASTAKTTNGYARVPHLFAQITQPDGEDYLLVPRVSSERREYIPIGFMHAECVASDAVQIIPDATLYHFGVLSSSVHMAWMRAVAGRLEMRYRYSKDIVYNNFPWPAPTEAQRERIGQAAQSILDERARHPGASLADLYDPASMPPGLREAHRCNDRAVLAAYGWKGNLAEGEVAARLLALYGELAGQGTGQSAR